MNNENWPKSANIARDDKTVTIAKGILSEQEGKALIAKGRNTSSEPDPLDNDDYWSIH